MSFGLSLDVPTLYAALTIVAWFFGAVLLALSVLAQERGGIRLWGFAYVLIAVGLTIVLYQDSLPLLVHGTVANVCFVAASVLLDRGVRRPERGMRAFGDLVVPAAALASLLVFTLLVPMVAARVGTLMLVVSFQSWRTVRRLAAQAGESEDGPRTALIVLTLFFTVLALSVSAITIAAPFIGVIEGATIPNPLHAVLVPGLMLFSIGAGMSHLWVYYMRIYAEVKRAATVDPLTGAKNRRYVMPELERLVQRSVREEKTLACLMIDADEFKQINDTHGHRKGDAVLVQLASRLQAAVREYDLVGRYGGEEFIVVIPELGADDVIRMAGRIHESVRTNPVDGVDVSVSVGVAFLSPEDDRPEDLIHRADMALLRAKNSGKDQIKVDEYRPARGSVS